MNVLMITPRFDEASGGDGLYAFRLGQAMRLQRIVIDVLTIRNSEFVLLREGSAPRPFQHVGKSLFTQNFYSLEASQAFAESVHIARPELVHIHGIHQYFTVSVAQKLGQLRIPSIATVHDYKIVCGNAGFFSDRLNDVCLKCLPGRFMPAVLERCKKGSFVASTAVAAQMGMWHFAGGLDYIDRFHCGSDFVEKLLQINPRIRHRVQKIRFPYLSPAPAGRVGQPRREKTNVAFVGRMVKHKGIEIFASAVRSLDVPIDIFGAGPLLDRAKSILAENSAVRFHGWKSHADMDTHLGMGSIVVVPYLAHETFCFVVVEAMLRGCCVVASARGAISELISHGQNGLLVTEPTSNNFRFAIEELLSHPEKIYSMGATAKEISSTLDSLEVHAQRVIEMYANVISERNSPA